MANPFEHVFKTLATGAQTGLAQVAAVYAAQQARNTAPSGRAGSGLGGAVPSGRAGSGISAAAQAAARARMYAETQRKMREAQQRIEQEIQNQRNKDAWTRLRNGKRLLDFNTAAPNERDGDGFRWLTRSNQPLDPLVMDPNNLAVDAAYRQGERTLAELTSRPWEQHPGMRPTIETAALSEQRKMERDSLAPQGPVLGPPMPKSKTTPQQEHLRGEKSLLPQAQVDVMVEGEFDKSQGYPGAYRLFRAVQDTKDPEARKYYDYLAQYNDDMVHGKLPKDPLSVEGDGDFGLTVSDNTGNPWSLPGANSSIFPYVLVKDPAGKFKMTYLPAFYNDLNQQAMVNPERAGELIVTLAALGAYGGGSDKYAQDRVQVITDKSGKTKVLGLWSDDDAKKLRAFMPQLTALQQKAAMDGRLEGIEQLMAEQALSRSNMVAKTATGGDSGGGGYSRRGYSRGGGGYGGYGGGGGGGYTQPVRLTDPAEIRALADGVARQRTGGGLNDEQHAALLKFVHDAERANAAAYAAGGEFQTVDPQSKAIEWITTNLADKAAAQAYGNYFMAFADFAGGGLGGDS